MLIFAQVLFWSIYLIKVALAVAAVIGAVTAFATRADAFEVAGRMQKMAWVAILAASTAAFVLPFHSNLLAVAAAVFTGIYWFDVRPQLRDILGNAGGW
ncbi:DUF2516 domain-containing protein [Corynebacterium sp. 13CS0277]|uniref:DUF2516 family protein n=1 Tax=Corynebacterium sp. 13CS0277 TaxID=2071994 RepID=UPI000D030202|nr:DUF2516 family protein [Corynebacterium sp. 13CS0277]PRQ12199.1 DUF2516 domain-containing protein [Corynebacterium sp. 13CS0277]